MSGSIQTAGNNANNLSLPSVDKAIGVTATRYCGCTSGSTSVVLGGLLCVRHMRNLRPGGRDLQIGLHIHSVCELLIDLPIALYAALIGEDGDGARSIRRIIRDEQGGVIIENTITMLVFVLLTIGITQAGLIMWSAVGLQHRVETATRCASVSDAAIAAGLKPATTPTPCYDTNNLTGAANHASKVQSYAASNSWGAGVRSSTFSVTAGTCASPSSLVSKFSPYRLSLINFLFSGAKISPRSCYPTNS